MNPPTVWIGLTLFGFIGMLYRYGRRLHRVEQWQRERSTMLQRIEFLEKELAAIKGSVPFQLFHGSGEPIKTGTHA